MEFILAYKDLREFISALENQGQLKRIREPVSPILEITEITDRVSKSSGPALLFEHVDGSEIPVLINAFGSLDRMCLALQVENLNQPADRLTELMEFKSPSNLAEKIKTLPKLADLAGFFPTKVRRAPCQEVVLEKDFSLLDLPILQCWPDDAGRFITLPLVFTKDPVTGKNNCGMYRMQVFDETITGMHWQIHKHGAHHYRKRQRDNQRMEVAVAVGADPVTTFAATLPLPEGFDEMLFAGFLRGKAVEMVPCRTVSLEVPAGAEIVLEGFVEVDETRTEGPFGDHTGFYSLADDYPVFHVRCITRRRKPIYHTTIVGRPPMEDCWMGKAIERILMPVLQKQFPEITDIHMPFEGVFHNLMIVAVHKAYPGHARKIMHGIWGLGQAMFSKCIVVVDHTVNIQDLQELTWAALNNIDPQRDMEFVMGPVDSLDHASRLPNYGSKVGVDATRKWPEEGFHRPWPKPLAMSPEIRALVDGKWEKYFK